MSEFAFRVLLAHAIGKPRSVNTSAAVSGVQAIDLAELARIDWIERSDVACLREGVVTLPVLHARRSSDPADARLYCCIRKPPCRELLDTRERPIGGEGLHRMNQVIRDIDPVQRLSKSVARDGVASDGRDLERHSCRVPGEATDCVTIA